MSHNRKIQETKREERLQKAESRSIRELIVESSDNVALAMKRANKIYTSSIEGLAKHDIDRLRKSKKGIAKLEKEIEELKGNIFYFIKNLDDSSLGITNFYIAMLNAMEDVAQSLEYISKAGYKHVNNNHKKLRFNQIKDLKEIDVSMEDLFERVREIFETKSFEELTPLIVNKQQLFNQVNEKIQKQVTRTRMDESSPKNTALYFSLLSETKDLLDATMDLLEMYDEHTNAASNLNA